MGKISHPNSVEELIFALDDESVDVKLNAITALGEIEDRKAITPLQKYSVMKNGVHVSVAYILKEKIEDFPLEPFIKGLDDEDWHVREKCVEIIGKYAGHGIKYLNQALNDDYKDVRALAAEIMSKMESEETSPMIKYGKKMKSAQHRLEEVIDEIGRDESIEILIEYLND